MESTKCVDAPTTPAERWIAVDLAAGPNRSVAIVAGGSRQGGRLLLEQKVRLRAAGVKVVVL